MSYGNERFYQPLKNSLDKSITRVSYYQQNNNWTHSPRSGSPIYHLSPEQANYIKQSTYVPIDRDLIPTNHIQRVRGRQFKAIDYQIKTGEPIPENIFRSTVHPQNKRQQIVYQLTNRVPYNSRYSMTNIRPNSPFIDRTPRIISSSPINHSSSVGKLESTLPQKSIYLCKGCTLSPRPNNISSIPPYLQHKSTFQQTKPKFNKVKSNKKYKYNLFSSFDQLVNTNCSNFGANQFIAKKPSNYMEWS